MKQKKSQMGQKEVQKLSKHSFKLYKNSESREIIQWLRESIALEENPRLVITKP